MPEHTIAENLTRLVNAKTAIGNAIIAKGGTVGTNDGLEEFASDIATIPAGGSQPTLITKTVTENGNYNAVDDQADGYSSVVVEVNPTPPEPVLMNRTVTPTTSEQTITADDGYDALGTVTVEAVTAAIDANITAGNIKKDVQILGVTGSYEGSSGGYNAELTTESETFNYSLYQEILKSIMIPSGITSIDDSSFYSCGNLTDVVIPGSVRSIGYAAFASCTSLTNITISEGLESIGNEAFSGDESLIDITIPSSVTSISGSAFDYCENLATITVHKAEDSITGAPWGATNATVIWDG